MAWWGNGLPWSRAIYNLFDLLGRPLARPAGRGLAGAPGPDGRAETGVPQGGRAGHPAGGLPPRGLHLRQAPGRRPHGRAGPPARRAAPRRRDPLSEEGERPGRGRPGVRGRRAGRSRDRALSRARPARGGRRPAPPHRRRCGGVSANTTRAAFVAATSMPGDWYRAGLVLLNKAGMPEPAIERFRLGWDHRPAANATACASSWP